MQPCPGCFVAAQSENSLHCSRTDTVLLAGHPPNGSEQQDQWFSCPFKDGYNNDRGLIVTRRAAYQPIARSPSFFVGLARASETIRPPQHIQLLSAGLFGRKSLLQLQKILGVILHALENYAIYLVVTPVVKGDTPKTIILEGLILLP
jgi:hypothetical protein